MKLLYLFLSFLFSFSHILDEIRKDIINKGLLYLPKRDDANILKMAVEMSKAIEQYSMTEAETAYFIYKWIGQNIEYDCYGSNHGNIINDSFIAYREGKGGEAGISDLFNTMCGLLNIESHIILGIEKYSTRNLTHLIDLRETSWNSVFIEEKYYLLDIVKGLGYCSGDKFTRTQGKNDDYFGISPEASIRQRFPNDNNWQLLSKPVTKAEFNSMALLHNDFFKVFKTISPDVQTLRNGHEVKIKLTFDKPIGSVDNVEVVAFLNSLSKEYLPEYIIIDDLKISNGTCEFTSYIGNGYLDITLVINSTSYGIVTYEVY